MKEKDKGLHIITISISPDLVQAVDKLIKAGDLVPSRSEFIRAAVIQALEKILVDKDTSFLTQDDKGTNNDTVTINLLMQHIELIDLIVLKHKSKSRSHFIRDAIRYYMKRQGRLHERGIAFVNVNRPPQKIDMRKRTAMKFALG